MNFPVAPTGASTDANEALDAELSIGEAGERGEGRVLFQDAPELAAGGLEGGGEAGGKGLVRGEAGEKPLQRDALVESEELAEALGEFLVAHDGVVADGDAVVAEPALDAAVAGDDVFAAVGEGLVDEGAVEGGFEVGQAGAEAEAGGQGAGGVGPVVGEFSGFGRAAEGGGGEALFMDAAPALEFAEEVAPDFGEGEGGADGGGDEQVEAEDGLLLGGGEALVVEDGVGGVDGGDDGMADGFREGFHGGECGVGGE